MGIIQGRIFLIPSSWQMCEAQFVFNKNTDNLLMANFLDALPQGEP